MTRWAMGLLMMMGGGVCSTPLAAQMVGPWSIEARAGATAANGEIADNDETGGIAVGADVLYQFASAASLYVGGHWYRFNCDGSECIGDRTGRGIALGAKIGFARRGSRAMPWLRGGLILDQAEIEGSDSDWAPGLELGAGVDIALTPSFSLVPAGRFYGFDAQFAQPEDDTAMRFFTIDVAAHFHP